MMKYLRARLREASTWTGVSAAIAAAAMLPSPYSWLVMACGIVAVLLPTAEFKR